MTTFLVLGPLGALIWAAGRWARREAAALVPEWVPADDRARREGVLRRGAGALCVAGVVVSASGVLALL